MAKANKCRLSGKDEIFSSGQAAMRKDIIKVMIRESIAKEKIARDEQSQGFFPFFLDKCQENMAIAMYKRGEITTSSKDKEGKA